MYAVKKTCDTSFFPMTSLRLHIVSDFTFCWHAPVTSYCGGVFIFWRMTLLKASITFDGSVDISVIMTRGRNHYRKWGFVLKCYCSLTCALWVLCETLSFQYCDLKKKESLSDLMLHALRAFDRKEWCNSWSLQRNWLYL